MPWSAVRPRLSLCKVICKRSPGHDTLTRRKLTVSPPTLKLERRIVARSVTMAKWPLIRIDLHTEEDIVGRSDLEPYTSKAMLYLALAISATRRVRSAGHARRTRSGDGTG